MGMMMYSYIGYFANVRRELLIDRQCGEFTGTCKLVVSQQINGPMGSREDNSFSMLQSCGWLILLAIFHRKLVKVVQ